MLRDIGFFQAAVKYNYSVCIPDFAAMIIDYYPGLAKVCDNREEMIKFCKINSQVFTFGLGTPMCLLILVFSNFNYSLTNEFLVIVSVSNYYALVH